MSDLWSSTHKNSSRSSSLCGGLPPTFHVATNILQNEKILSLNQRRKRGGGGRVWNQQTRIVAIQNKRQGYWESTFLSSTNLKGLVWEELDIGVTESLKLIFPRPDFERDPPANKIKIKTRGCKRKRRLNFLCKRKKIYRMKWEKAN